MGDLLAKFWKKCDHNNSSIFDLNFWTLIKKSRKTNIKRTSITLLES
jgi:hypothetical protein